MDRHRLNPHILLRPILLIHGDLLDLSQRLQARVAQNLAEHSVQPVQVRCRSKRDEELAAVRIGPLVCHADHAALVVSQPWADLVFEGWPPDRAPALGIVGRVGVRWRAGLDHEACD